MAIPILSDDCNKTKHFWLRLSNDVKAQRDLRTALARKMNIKSARQTRTEWKNGNCDSLSSWRSQKIHIHLWIMTIPILSDNAKITYLKIHFDLIIESVERHSWPSLAQPTPIIHSVAAVRTSNRETGSCVSQKWDGKLREQRKLLKLVSLCLIWPKL